MEHIGLLGILFNLLVALWIALIVFQYRKSYENALLEPLFHYCLVYSLLVFVGLVFLYVTLNLPRNLSPDNFPHLNSGIFLLVSLIEIGMVYSMLRIYMGFRGRKISVRFKGYSGAAVLLLILSYGLKFFLSKGSVSTILNTFHSNIFDNVLIFELLLLILILTSGGKEKDRNKIRLRRSFGWLFLMRYAVLVGIIFVFVIFISNTDEIIPRAIRYPLALICVLFFSLAPYVWIKFFFLKYAQSLLVIVEDKEILGTIYGRFGISPREQEILRLILDGKSNKEIEEALFISYHTVKNHVYNLYQKLGVKNRYELVHFITKFKKE